MEDRIRSIFLKYVAMPLDERTLQDMESEFMSLIESEKKEAFERGMEC